MSQTNFDVEIAKVVGEEVAKKALASFDDEKLNNLVNNAIANITTREKESSFYNSALKPSKLDQMISASLIDIFKVKINERLNSEEHKKAMDEIAVTMVDDIIEQTRKMMIAQVSQRMASTYVNPDMQLSYDFSNIMREMIQRMPRPY